MLVRQDARSLVKSAFPGRDALIDRGFQENVSFRDLCRDYRECSLALERWRRLSGADPSARAREYAGLLEMLAEELESCLSAMDDSSAAPLPGVAP
jgi:hypothetical protein